MLFCALGAIMLIFALQERSLVEMAFLPGEREATSSIARRTATLLEASASEATHWPGVQAPPALDGQVVFVLDLSGSLANDAQQRAQRHLVTNYVLQNRIEDFAVVHFATTPLTSIEFGPWDDAKVRTMVASHGWNESVVHATSSRAARRLRSLEDAGLPRSEIQRIESADLPAKLAWLEVMIEEGLPGQVVGSSTEIDLALEAAATLARASGGKPHVVLASDGVDSSPLGGPATLGAFERRIAVSLVDPSASSFARGVAAMQRFASASDDHVVISGYGVIARTRQPSEAIPVDGVSRDPRFSGEDEP